MRWLLAIPLLACATERPTYSFVAPPRPTAVIYVAEIDAALSPYHGNDASSSELPPADVPKWMRARAADAGVLEEEHHAPNDLNWLMRQISGQ